MNYEEFVDQVKNNILSHCPAEFQKRQVRFTEKYKGEHKLTGMILEKNVSEREECSIAPVLYLDSYYAEMCEQNLTFNQILEWMIRDYQEAELYGRKVWHSTLADKTRMMNNLYTQVMNAEKNKSLLEEVPHVQLNDIAIIPRINVDGDGSIIVTNAICKGLGLNADEVLDMAMKNNIKVMKPVVSSLSDVVLELTSDMELGQVEVESVMENSTNTVYVLTNESKIYGASLITDKQLLNVISDTIGEEFYILPSSVHEVLLYPNNESNMQEAKELKHTVMEINASVLEPEDFLSDNIYVYNAKKQELQMYSGIMEPEKREKKNVKRR